jgi:hypothetical protein
LSVSVTPPPASVSDALLAMVRPPTVALAESVGKVPTAGMNTESVALGTPAGAQFVAVVH